MFRSFVSLFYPSVWSGMPAPSAIDVDAIEADATPKEAWMYTIDYDMDRWLDIITNDVCQTRGYHPIGTSFSEHAPIICCIAGTPTHVAVEDELPPGVPIELTTLPKQADMKPKYIPPQDFSGHWKIQQRHKKIMKIKPACELRICRPSPPSDKENKDH